MVMRNFGWIPQHPDFRDYTYSKKVVKRVEEPPVKYLICPPVKDQENLGSCVFNGTTTAMESADVEIRNIIPPIQYSRLYAYYKYRVENNIPVNYDSGASIRDVIKQIAREGICYESTWPYDLNNWTKKPPAEAEQEANNHKILEYFALETVDDMVQCVASGWGFVFGISCYESFDSEYTATTGKITIPEPNEKWLGGHCMYIWGYDKHLFDGKGGFHYQNSYGEEWGKKGRGTISFEYLANPRLAMDFWTIRN
jgi:C1A family cysteine protease